MLKLETDGDRHELLGHAVTAIALALCIITRQSFLFTSILCASSIFSTLYLSPDLDQFRTDWGCKALHRWKKLGLWSAWGIYLSLIPNSHHRGITHTPVLGAIVVGWPFMLTGYLLGFGVPVAIGIVIQQLTHIAWDGV